MEINDQPVLKFFGVDIVNVNFISTSLLKDQSKIDIEIEPQVFLPVDNPSIFKIIMKVTLKDDEHFQLDLVAVGNFEISAEQITEEIKKNFINANATAIMFPYIRSFIASFTSNLGSPTGTINIPIKFFKGNIKELNIPSNENQIHQTSQPSLK